jgi:WD40-like Beta Propeller Repeat
VIARLAALGAAALLGTAGAASAAPGRIVYPGTCGAAVGLCVVDDDLATAPRLVVRGGAVPSWSPDGRWIAYSAPGGIAVVAADGSSAPTVLTAPVSPRIDTAPVFSADGASIFWQRETGATHSAIWRMRPDGGGQRRVVDNRGRADRQPLQLPGGRTLTFTRDELLVRTRQAAATSVVKLVTGVALPLVRVSPDGGTYAFVWDPVTLAPAARNGRVWTVPADGSTVAARTEDSGVFGLRWSRDARHLLGTGLLTTAPYVIDATYRDEPQRPAALAGVANPDWWTPRGPAPAPASRARRRAPGAIAFGQADGPLPLSSAVVGDMIVQAGKLHLAALDPDGVTSVRAAFVRRGSPLRGARYHEVSAPGAFERLVGRYGGGRFRLLVRTRDRLGARTPARHPLQLAVTLRP